MKRALAVLVVALLSSAVVGALFVNLGEANFKPALPSEIIFYSPYEAEVYGSAYLPLNFTIGRYSRSWAGIYTGEVESLFYRIDGQEPVTVAVDYPPPPDFALIYAAGNSILPALMNGVHNLTLWGTVKYVPAPLTDYQLVVENITATVSFTIAVPLPTFSNVSMRNVTYSSTQIPLSFEVDVPTSWIGYSVDGNEPITFNGNTTLTGLSGGSHTLIIYANDTAGNMGQSETIYFSVAQPFPETLLLTGAAVAAVVIFAGLMLYFTKFKKRRNQA